MTPRKQVQLLGSQTSMAQKVYECVPEESLRDLHDVYAELKAQHGCNAGLNVVRACLGALEDQNLIKCVRGMFQRVAVKDIKPKDTLVKPTLASVMPTAMTKKAPTAVVLTKSTEAAAAEVKPTHTVHATPLALLADISADMYAFAAESHQKLRSLAERIGEAALIIEQDREANEQYMAKMRQLQSLLKSLGEGA